MSDADVVVKLEFLDHPKVAGLSCEALGVWLKALLWAKKKESDGRLSVEAAEKLCLSPRGIASLVKVGLLDVATEFDGWSFHDFLHWNRSSAKVQEKLEANRQRVARHRAAKHAAPAEHGNALQPSAAPPAKPLSRPPPAAPLELPQYAQRIIERQDLATVHDLVPTTEALDLGAKWFCELTQNARPGLVFDRHYFRHAYTNMGLRPESERRLVAKHYRLTKYIQARPTKYDPDHVWKKWADFVTGPREMDFAKPLAKTFKPGAPSSREDIALLAQENPEWAKAP